MAITNPTASLFLDTRSILKKTGKHPVKLTVYYLGHKRRYGLPYSFTEAEWKKLFSAKLRDNTLKEAKVKLEYYSGEKFETALKKIDGAFDFDKFKAVYIQDNSLNLANRDVYALFNRYIAELQKSGNVGNAQVYTSALKTFQNFRKRLSFNDISPAFLSAYEKDMLDTDKSVGYISMNLRCLRAIYNMAIVEGMVNVDKYPFSKSRNDKKYVIKKGESHKKALTLEELRLLKNYQPKTPAQRKAWLYWWFSFYGNGLNTKDICLLKNKNISGNILNYTRAKTRNSTTNNKVIQMFYSPEIKSIIDEIGNADKSPEAYIFNILKHGITPKQERDMVMSFTRNINKHMKNISLDLKFEDMITTYWARHSFSTHLKRNNIAIGIISEALGHTTTETTEIYLDSFNIETLKKTADVLAYI